MDGGKSVYLFIFFASLLAGIQERKGMGDYRPSSACLYVSACLGDEARYCIADISLWYHV